MMMTRKFWIGGVLTAWVALAGGCEARMESLGDNDGGALTPAGGAGQGDASTGGIVELGGRPGTGGATPWIETGGGSVDFHTGGMDGFTGGGPGLVGTGGGPVVWPGVGGGVMQTGVGGGVSDPVGTGSGGTVGEASIFMWDAACVPISNWLLRAYPGSTASSLSCTVAALDEGGFSVSGTITADSRTFSVAGSLAPGSSNPYEGTGQVSFGSQETLNQSATLCKLTMDAAQSAASVPGKLWASYQCSDMKPEGAITPGCLAYGSFAFNCSP